MRARPTHLLAAAGAALLGCGGSAYEPGLFEWGPAGEPRPFVRPVDDMVGDWLLCSEPSCPQVERVGYRLHPSGVGRLLAARIDEERRARRCPDERPSGLLWTYEQGVLTMRVDPNAPPIRRRNRLSASVAFVVDQYGSTVRWTLIPPSGDSDLLPGSLEPSPRRSLTDATAVQVRAVRLPTPERMRDCVEDVFQAF